ncbi:hypothetical protein Dacet_1582 [Denitrovibrio acetiphilus DSM 12809]|uniref:Tetrahaem cytochrome domain-containing protein n=1 Tax=Denitrovibrio acetiphilus (strain DSM 12809 / NBRC 114555 / N2460) TaxID=522772 RepID=D4H8K1_DENA2|nr:cytochrome c3 family protein [Denitrovibrio acetiphilus]ADD68350.1 hypothetical protein Dacet_1582 [Denitrovibrio acetiphilus DSM 12809]
MKYILTIAAVFLFSFAAVSAGEIGFKCSECHETPQDILPDGHITKKVFEGCFDCHQTGKKVRLSNKVHAVHISFSDISGETCLSCHIEAEPGLIRVDSVNDYVIETEFGVKSFQSLYTTGKLANSHKNAGLSCGDCHATYDYDEIDNMAPKCKECHGDYPEVSKLTADAEYETNPHESHFPNLACTKCHSVHDDFKDYCSEKCHKWDFNWQQKVSAK